MQKSTQQESQLETFICKLCEQEFEVMHDVKYELSGIVKRKSQKESNNEVHSINIQICEYCLCELVETEGY